MANLKPGRYQGRDPATGRKMLDGVTAIVSERTGEITYQARWEWADPTGRRKQKTTTRKTLDAAEEAKLKGELEARQGPTSPPVMMTLNTYFRDWHKRESLRWAPSTAFTIRTNWERIFEESIGDVPITKVNRRLCQDEVARLVAMRKPKQPEKPYYKASTVNYYILLLKMVLNAAVDDEVIATNPARRLTLPRSPEHQKTVWTADTTAYFLEQTRESDSSLLWWFLATTGARIGEALALRWSHLDLDQPAVTFRSTVQRQADGTWGMKEGTKTSDTPKVIPLLPSVAERFRAAQRQARSGPVVALDPYIFVGRNGKPLTVSAAQQRLRRDCRLAGVHEISPHVFRHTAGTLLVSMGVPESMVQLILRHKSIITTLGTYVHPNQDDLRRALNHLDGALNTTTSDAEKAPKSGAV